MGDIALTKAEADDHLRMLREKRGIKEDKNDISDSVLVSSLNKALELLSDQLYTTTTHFLLELIQNADDNTYRPGVVPRLHLSLYEKDGKMFFRSDCNEVGFTYQQLDALTQIGDSTKKAITDGRKGYIGEKGIGFKSVFKVADVVHIASGLYEFKLDRRQTIGMMLPILSRFPSEDRVEGHTQVLLEIKNRDDYRQIKQELEGIEPQILLFIRKLKQVDISVDGHTKTYERTTNTWDDDFGGETSTILKTTDDVTQMNKYIIHRQTVSDLPSDSRREGVRESEIVLAFPIRDNATPITEPQKVFAFLPIQCYGFPFLIHADFLLIASRESLQYGSQWNQALQRGIKDAVVAMIVDRFVNLGAVDDPTSLRYSWPKYLERRRERLPFWDELHQNILNDLRTKPILWSREEGADVEKPNGLYYVPELYRFEGETLFNLPSINKTHLSFAYDDVSEHLCTIGVSPLSLNDLCDEFCQWVEAVGIVGLRGKSAEWHRAVCKVFSGVFEDNTTVRNRLRQLPIVPLRDGSWVKATQPNLYLPSSNKDELVPSGVESISIIDHDAAQDEFRRKLYSDLGIVEYSPRQVCRLILDVHRKLAVEGTARSHRDLIADTLYLFKHRSEISSLTTATTPPRLFFLCEKNGKPLVRSRPRIYLIDPKLSHGIIAKYKDTPGSPFTVLSDEYEGTLCENAGVTTTTTTTSTKSLAGTCKDFRKWLLQLNSSVFATTPDLLRNSSLTPEWKFLYEQDVTDLLYSLKATLLLRSNTMSPPPPELVEAISGLKIRCLDGVSRALGSLAVPTPDLRQVCPHLDFADLPEPTLENWGFLSDFGVVMEVGTTAILTEFEALRRLPVQDISPGTVKYLYEALNQRAADRDKEDIMEAFKNQPLVFVPTPSPGIWVSHMDCVWTAPDLLSHVTKLEKHYRNCEGLFRTLLGVHFAETRHVVDEFCQPSTTPVTVSGRQGSDQQQQQQRFEKLLLWLDRYHNNNSRLTDEQIARIRSAKVFPILTGPSPSMQQDQVQMSTITDGNWYIPDSVTLEAELRGKVDMLVLPVPSAKKLEGLFKILGSEKRFLSVSVHQVIRPTGLAVRNTPEEEDMRERLKSIICLIKEKKGIIASDIPSLRVFSVPSITVTMSLNDIKVIRDDKLVTIDDSGDTIDIYLRDGFNPTHRPLITFELVQYFRSLLRFDDDLTNLVTLLMGAPIDRLHKILEQHDIMLPRVVHDAEVSENTDSPVIDVDMTDEQDDAPTESHQDLPRLSHDVDSSKDHHYKPRAISISSDSDIEQVQEATPSKTMTSSHRRHYELTPRHRDLVPSKRTRRDQLIINEDNTIHVISDHVGDGGYSRNYTSNSPANKLGRALQMGSTTSTTGLLRSPLQETASAARNRRIGYQGELFIHEMFAKKIPDWTYKNWTSSLRVEAGHPPFLDSEREHSDFTYLDATGQMKKALLLQEHEHETGIGIGNNSLNVATASAQWSATTTFHLEVKSTLGVCAEPMFVSQYQVDKMRLYDKDPDNAYILVRVFNLEAAARDHGNDNTSNDGNGNGIGIGVRFFCDPWSLYLGGVLDFKSEGGYNVFIQ